MIVSKFRNAPENLKILVFRVTPEEGITQKPWNVSPEGRCGQTTCPKRSGLAIHHGKRAATGGFDASGIDADAWEVLEGQLEATIPNYDRGTLG